MIHKMLARLSDSTHAFVHTIHTKMLAPLSDTTPLCIHFTQISTRSQNASTSIQFTPRFYKHTIDKNINTVATHTPLQAAQKQRNPCLKHLVSRNHTRNCMCTSTCNSTKHYNHVHNCMLTHTHAPTDLYTPAYNAIQLHAHKLTHTCIQCPQTYTHLHTTPTQLLRLMGGA
jgi:hypothetical protein